MLALPGPEHPYRHDGDYVINGLAIRLHQEGGQGRGTAWAVWDGAIVLAKWLEHCSPAERQRLLPPGSTFLELGSGTGVAGLSAAACYNGAERGILTDLPAALPALQRNVNLNSQARLHGWVWTGVVYLVAITTVRAA